MSGFTQCTHEAIFPQEDPQEEGVGPLLILHQSGDQAAEIRDGRCTDFLAELSRPGWLLRPSQETQTRTPLDPGSSLEATSQRCSQRFPPDPPTSPSFSLDSTPTSGGPSGSVIGECLKNLPLPPGRRPVLKKHCGVSTDSFLRPEMVVEGAELPPVSAEHWGPAAGWG